MGISGGLQEGGTHSPSTCRTSEGTLTGSGAKPVKVELCRKISWNSWIAPISTMVRLTIAVATACGKIWLKPVKKVFVLSVFDDVGRFGTENGTVLCQSVRGNVYF